MQSDKTNKQYIIMKTAIVLGAGGFIGAHLVKRLKQEGYWVRGVDLKYPPYAPTQADQFIIGDLRNPETVKEVMIAPSQDLQMGKGLKVDINNNKGFDEVYQLAADMGGAGFVFTGENDADIMHNSALINLNICEWAYKYGVKRFSTHPQLVYILNIIKKIQIILKHQKILHIQLILTVNMDGKNYLASIFI